MGRRQLRHPVPAEEEEIQKSENIADIVTAMMDLCGSCSSTSRRHELTSALGKLKIRLQDATPWDGATCMNGHVSTFMLQLENDIEVVRRESLNYLDYLIHEHADMMELVQDLEEERALWSWILACRSICAAYSVQNQVEERAVRRLLQTLDMLYRTIDDTYYIPVIQKVLMCLRRDGLLLRHDFLELLDLLERIKSKETPESSVAVHLAYDNALDEEAIDIASLSITSAKSVWRAIEEFLNPVGGTAASAVARVTFLLIVGPDGSGKTHVCNKLSTLAKASMCKGE
jgi:hypothetical protein